ncbi:family 61 putative glycoside hydrolase [Microthyrium microscopicum]|uniref:AA9 family lytic polysaccharide monooxygenase n=1 Tax=Microthyrium microscopicum TaxID=703497 RepID=A0A6A6US51_9PEZI|nr:family 61 putative glycoside hydrolase [Microthyrium microscopicum]
MGLQALLSVLLALVVSQVIAHGAIVAYTIDGKEYPGYKGFQPAASPPTIQRQWNNYEPSKDIADPRTRCHGGTSAPLSAPVSPGSTIVAKWDYWPHYQGPVMVWLYACNGPFDKCDGSSRGWFKIDQVGMLGPPLSGKNWGQAKIPSEKKWTVKVPKVAAGNYLVRHEIIAIHTGNAPQFYAECAQLNVSGSGGGKPGMEYLVSIPGYANMSHPGIKIDIYTSKATKYEIPGPPVWHG